jgi:hypothetical protein
LTEQYNSYLVLLLNKPITTKHYNANETQQNVYYKYNVTASTGFRTTFLKLKYAILAEALHACLTETEHTMDLATPFEDPNMAN